MVINGVTNAQNPNGAKESAVTAHLAKGAES